MESKARGRAGEPEIKCSCMCALKEADWVPQFIRLCPIFPFRLEIREYYFRPCALLPYQMGAVK